MTFPATSPVKRCSRHPEKHRWIGSRMSCPYCHPSLGVRVTPGAEPKKKSKKKGNYTPWEPPVARESVVEK